MTKPASAIPSVPITETHTAGSGRQEIEVKFRTDRDGLKRAQASQLVASVSAPRTETVRSTYFDTPSGDLRKNGIVLRIRRKGRAAPILGVKAAQAGEGPFSRIEQEVRSPNRHPDLTLFDEATANELTALVGDCPLAAQFETSIKRRTILVERGRTQIEVAFDDGVIAVAGRSVPLTEIELELKAGDEPALYDLAMSLAEELPLRLDFVSKGERGFRAVSGETAAAVKAIPILFAPEATLDDAVQAVISNTLWHFVANWAALRERRIRMPFIRCGWPCVACGPRSRCSSGPCLARNSISSGKRQSGLPRRSDRRANAMSFAKPSPEDRWRIPIGQRTATRFLLRSRGAEVPPMTTHARGSRIATRRCSS